MATLTTRPAPIRDSIRLDEIPDVADLIPWNVVDLSLRPFRGAWSMNPSVHYDGQIWRCVIRCADYAMPSGVTIRGPQSAPGYVISRNAMVILDPDKLRPEEVFVMNEDDPLPRVAACTNAGYEDVRLFHTANGGLQGIAASLHLDRRRPTAPRSASIYRPQSSLRRKQPQMSGRAQTTNIAHPAPARGRYSPVNRGGGHPPEQVLIGFDDEYNIVEAHPIRGQWSGRPQKNWAPFDGADDPMFLYSIEGGRVFDVNGPLGEVDEPTARQPPAKNFSGTEVRLLRTPMQLQSGRGGQAGYKGLRGGTQLHHIGDALDRALGRPLAGGGWIGLAHDMRFVHGKKFYWHVVYAVDSTGELVGVSDVFKLDITKGIEFAAGLAVDGDRAVISYGIDDMQCKLGETSLEALLGLVEPIVTPDDLRLDARAHDPDVSELDDDLGVVEDADAPPVHGHRTWGR